MKSISETKTCSDCGVQKPIVEFYKKNSARRECRCIPCFRVWRGLPAKRTYSAIARSNLEAQGLRRCSRCASEKALEEFYVFSSGKRSSQCKPCARETVFEKRPSSGIRRRNIALREHGAKECSNCRKERPFSSFGKATTRPDGLNAYCKVCARKLGKKRYRVDVDSSRAKSRKKAKRDSGANARNRANRTADPRKHRARLAVNYAIGAGHLARPSVCERCNGGHRIEAHHESYDAPLDIVWLCVMCHRERHGELRLAGIVP